MPHVMVRDLVKTYRIAERSPGLLGAMRGVISRSYREVTALASVSFCVERGELLGFIGPNGAGKSTTIEILSGILQPTSGRVQVGGLSLSRFVRFGQGLIALVLASEHAPIVWTVASSALLVWAIAGGVALFMGILVLQGTLAFFTIESLEVANVLTYGGVQAAQYPLAVYARWLRRLLIWIVPFGAVAYFPVLVVLCKEDPLGFPAWIGAVSPLLGFLFLGGAFLAWRWGVRHYMSTGS